MLRNHSLNALLSMTSHVFETSAGSGSTNRYRAGAVGPLTSANFTMHPSYNMVATSDRTNALLSFGMSLEFETPRNAFRRYGDTRDVPYYSRVKNPNKFTPSWMLASSRGF